MGPIGSPGAQPGSSGPFSLGSSRSGSAGSSGPRGPLFVPGQGAAHRNGPPPGLHGFPLPLLVGPQGLPMGPVGPPASGAAGGNGTVQFSFQPIGLSGPVSGGTGDRQQQALAGLGPLMGSVASSLQDRHGPGGGAAAPGAGTAWLQPLAFLQLPGASSADASAAVNAYASAFMEGLFRNLASAGSQVRAGRGATTRQVGRGCAAV